MTETKNNTGIAPAHGESAEESSETTVKKLEKSIADLESELFPACEGLQNIKIELHDVRNITEKILGIIPKIRREKARLHLLKALIHYKEPLRQSGVNTAALNFVVQKRAEKILGQSFRLDLPAVTAIEKELDIFCGFFESEANADLFIKLRKLLEETKDLDKIEVIVRKMRLNIQTPSEIASQIRKEDNIRYFTNEAGFAEPGSVMELLTHKNPAEVIQDKAITEKEFKKEIKKLEGEFDKISKHVLAAVAKKDIGIRRMLDRNIPFIARLFSDYILSPIATSASVLGTLIILFFALGRFAAEPLKNIFPVAGGILYSAGIVDISQLASPVYVVIISITLILIGGLLKRIDDKVKHR